MIGTAIGLAIGLESVGRLGKRLKGHRPEGLLILIGVLGFGFGIFMTVMAFLVGVMAEYPREPVPWWQCEIMIFLGVIIPTVLTGMIGLPFVRERRAES